MSYRKKRPLDRTVEHVSDTNLFIIATEGEKTEPLYFSMKVFGENKKTQIKIIPTEDGSSSPKSVLDRLHKYAVEFQFGEGDQFWLVIDRDRWETTNLRNVIELCRNSNYNVALSNPCFELWLLLHFRKVEELDLHDSMSASDIKGLFNPFFDQRNKGNFDDTFQDWINHAIVESAKLDQDPKAPYPECPGTRVHVLVEELLS